MRNVAISSEAVVAAAFWDEGRVTQYDRGPLLTMYNL
jgi:hypothetical protein